jgi:hypothetical protein
MARRRDVVVGMVFLLLGLSMGCQAVGPRRARARQDPLPVSAAPASGTMPARGAMPASVPGNNEIIRVSVPPVAVEAGATVKPVERSATPASGDPRGLHQRAVSTYAGIDSYTARLRRREQVGGKDMPEELILAQFRKQPFSVHFKWIGTEGQGREVIYVKGRHDDKLYTLLAPTDPHLFSKVMALPLDSPLIRSRSRYPITDAGIGSLIDRFGNMLATAEKLGPEAPVKYLGAVKRPEYTEPLDGVEQTIPPRAEPLLPGGGRRWWFFDPQNGLPVLVITHDAAGQQVEFYCYDRLMYPVRLDDADFDPTRLGKEKR